jgi:hypothetical protein
LGERGVPRKAVGKGRAGKITRKKAIARKASKGKKHYAKTFFSDVTDLLDDLSARASKMVPWGPKPPKKR